MRRRRLATANVLTLWPAVDSTEAPSTRRCQLADSMAALGVQVLGIQEARACEPTCRECAGYFMVGAQADDAGGSGVELWLHESLGVRRDMIWCLSAGPRLLVVRVTLWATDLLFAAAHAPHHNPGQTDSAARVRAWWSAFVDDVRHLNVDELPVIALVDANAKVGSVVTPQIGPAEAVMENVAGACMREALAELALCTPSTLHSRARPDMGRTHGAMEEDRLRTRPRGVVAGVLGNVHRRGRPSRPCGPRGSPAGRRRHRASCAMPGLDLPWSVRSDGGV